MTLLATAHLVSGSGYQQNIRTGRHAFVADEPVVLGGQDAGPSPFGLVLSGLAACTAITLRMYAERKTWDLGELRIDLRVEEEGEARRVTRVLKFADHVPADQRARFAEIAEKTPVTRALRAGFAIDTTIG